MKAITVLAQGKLKEPGLRDICRDYYQRCATRFQVRELEVRDLSRLRAALPSRGPVIVLDERGRELSSAAFATELGRWLEDRAGPPCFVIGGADGLDDAVRARATLLLSLGRMTFAHRLVRVLLAEQLYRATSILQGTPYHTEHGRL